MVTPNIIEFREGPFEHLSSNLARDPDYLDRLVDEVGAGAFLDVAPRTMQDWRLKGGGPRFVRLSARCIKYRRRDLIEFAEGRLRASTSDPGPEADAA